MPDASVDIAQPYPVTRGGNLPGKFQGWCQAQPVVGDKCTRCLHCWILCPEGALRAEGGPGSERLVVDYDYCKGCGICALECPLQAIEMIEVGRVERQSGTLTAQDRSEDAGDG